MNFALKVGYPKCGFSIIKRNVMQFINYILWVQSTKQFFIVAPTLFRRLFSTYIWFDIYPETLVVATIQVQFRQQVLLFTLFHYWNYRRHFIGHLNDIQSLKISALKHDQRARRCKVTRHWSGDLAEGLHPNMHWCSPLSTSLLTMFSWKCDTTLS